MKYNPRSGRSRVTNTAADGLIALSLLAWVYQRASSYEMYIPSPFKNHNTSLK